MPPKIPRKKHEKKKSGIQDSLQFKGDSDDESESDSERQENLPQLELPDEELDKDVTTVLNAVNPYFSKNWVVYDYKKGKYKPITNFIHSVVLFETRGTVVHKKFLEEKESAEGKDLSESGDGKLDVKRKNKFNFCSRAVQTFEIFKRDQYCQSKVPGKVYFENNACLWEMTEAYRKKAKEDSGETIEDDDKEEEEGKEEEEDEYKDPSDKYFVEIKVEEKEKEKAVKKSKRLLKVAERMVNQNQFSDVIIDFATYDNPMDEYLEQGAGSILPLWKFSCHNVKGKTVTDISWNLQYPDMFAVGYGTVDFMKYDRGFVGVYTMKCPTFPEWLFPFEKTVECVQFSPYAPHLLAVGLSDGVIAVLDLTTKSKSPVVTSLYNEIRHTDLVTQIHWLQNNSYGESTFCSISHDGRVINWILTSNEFVSSDIVTLNKGCKGFEPSESPDGAELEINSSGTCISFNAGSTKLFLVGTMEGLIHAYSSLYYKEPASKVYTEHTNVVYSVEWNFYHPRIFLSCSADWTVRIWDYEMEKSVFMFDMGSEVRCAAWAPFSSTLFGAVTSDGKLHVFDLAYNRHSPTGSQGIYVKKKNVTPSVISFNPEASLVIIGDNRGSIISFKLSPNLRSSLKVSLSMEREKFVASEIERMNKVLKLAKSPSSSEKM